MNHVYLLIGGNKGNRIKCLEETRNKIALQIGLILKNSSVYETEPWGFEDECFFLNQCLLVETLLSPHDVLKSIKKIEAHFDKKTRRNSGLFESRNMDIDILFYNDLILNDKDLKIPHPLLAERKFVLTPLAEIKPDLIHPVIHKTVRELLAQCPDNKMVVLYEL
jgi:2-amino-4-hydroxy-6-hydroxymethyldihydropteridine diphosphokinase